MGCEWLWSLLGDSKTQNGQLAIEAAWFTWSLSLSKPASLPNLKLSQAPLCVLDETPSSKWSSLGK